MLVEPMSDWLLRHMLGESDADVTAQSSIGKQQQINQQNPYSILWREWHLVRNPTLEWLADWLSRMPPSCSCVEDFMKFLKANPPDFADWFPYSVLGHNFVNAKLGRPSMTVDEARSLWFPNWAFVTLNDLNAATLDLAAKLPPIRGVAGVPVSGMLVAPTLSTLLHVPLYEASVEFGIRRCAHGYRGSSRHVDESLPLLIVDDTICSGRSLGDVRNKLQGEHNLLYAVALANPPASHLIDIYGRRWRHAGLRRCVMSGSSALRRDDNGRS
jgi:hypothetical protein